MAGEQIVSALLRDRAAKREHFANNAQMLRDLAEKKRAEEEQKRKEELYRAALSKIVGANQGKLTGLEGISGNEAFNAGLSAQDILGRLPKEKTAKDILTERFIGGKELTDEQKKLIGTYISPTKPSIPTAAGLLADATGNDVYPNIPPEQSQKMYDKMQADKIEQARATGQAQAEGRTAGADLDATAKAVIEGRETIENVRNTFGTPVQEMVRARVLEMVPDFNFVKPRANVASIKSSLTQQQKQRGMMGSFVKNINKQLNRVDTMMKDVINRVGVRALDLPIRELKTRFKGSGHEKALEAYLIEISNEIGKLSTGSSASIRELSTDAQERWAKIHDPNLSFNELVKILNETSVMADMRIMSTDEEITETLNLLDNVNTGRNQGKDNDPAGIR